MPIDKNSMLMRAKTLKLKIFPSNLSLFVVFSVDFFNRFVGFLLDFNGLRTFFVAGVFFLNFAFSAFSACE